MINFLLKNLLRKIFLDKTNFLILFFIYSLLMSLLYGLLGNYIKSGSDLDKEVVSPLINTFNVLLSFYFIFKFPDYISLFYGQENNLFFSRLKIKPIFINTSLIIASIFFGFLLILPMLSFLLQSSIIGEPIFMVFYHHCISVLFLFTFLGSWSLFFFQVFSKRTVVILLTFLIISFFTFLNEFSQIINNFFFSKLLFEFSFVNHLNMMQNGIYRLKDFIYFLSWPIGGIVIHHVFFPKGVKSKNGLTRLIRIVGVTLSVFLVFLINFIAHKKNMTFDFSPTGKMSLAKQTEVELSKLSKKVYLKVFSSNSDSHQIEKILSLMNEWQIKVEYEFIDPDVRHDLVLKHNIIKIPAIVVSGLKQKTIYDINESTITSAIMAVDKKQHNKIAILDERFQSKVNFNKMINEFKKSYHELIKINDIESVSSFNTLFFIVENDLNNIHQIQLENFINSGGQLYLFLPPNFNNRFSSWPKFLNSFGLNYTNHFIVDFDQNVSGSKGTAPYVNNGRLLNGANFFGRLIFPIAGNIYLNSEFDSSPSDFNLVVTTQGSTNSWAESNVDEINSTLSFGENDLSGPNSFVVMSPFYDNGKKIITFSSANFLDDQIAASSRNIQYLLEIIDSQYGIKVEQTVRTSLSSLYKKQNNSLIPKLKIFLWFNPLLLLLGFIFLKRRNDT